jgi:hypothetical protein
MDKTIAFSLTLSHMDKDIALSLTTPHMDKTSKPHI